MYILKARINDHKAALGPKYMTYIYNHPFQPSMLLQEQVRNDVVTVASSGKGR